MASAATLSPNAAAGVLPVPAPAVSPGIVSSGGVQPSIVSTAATTAVTWKNSIHTGCLDAKDLLVSLFGYILVPKFLIIENFRLGILCRFLQFCAVSLVVTQILVQKQWIYYSTPSGELYYLDGAFAHAGANRHDAGAEYCANIAKYDFSDGAMAVKPTKCLDLPNTRRSYPEGQTIFVPTYVVEKQQSFDTAGCTALASSCTNPGDVFSPIGTHTEASSGECVCENTHEYFVSKPEDTQVDFHFRFEAAQEDSGKRKERGSTDTRINKPYSVDMTEEPYVVENLDHEIITTLRRKGTKDATVGGLRFVSTAGQPVSIPVSAFLQAANIGGLEQSSVFANHKHANDNTLLAAAPLRSTGVDIAISINCARKDLGVTEEQDLNVYCDINADAEPAWTTRTDAVSDDFNSRTGSGVLKTKKQHGVRLSFRMTGRFGYFSTSIFIGSLTSAIVLLELPGKAVMLLALFCLGLLSRVYYSCQSQRLNLRHQVHGFAARMINAKKSYEQILGEHKLSSSLDRATLGREMKQAFHHLCEEFDEEGNPIPDDNKPLQAAEVEKMCDLVYHGLDEDQEGGISLDEYVDASTSNEVLRVGQICQFFDDERPKTCLERVFDDSKWQLDEDKPRKRAGSKDPSATPRQAPGSAADIFMNL
ncbi:unnamed protein product [Amoebophrya sp. A25]|nr:unnamed protein product [Amoebophrya sp. A25]|eukprot:GSA25T00002007001.1